MSNAVLCVKCNTWKLPEKMHNINKRKRSPNNDGRTGICKTCGNAYNREYRNRLKETNPERYEQINAQRTERRRRQIERMTPEELKAFRQKAKEHYEEYERNMTPDQKEKQRLRNQRAHRRMEERNPGRWNRWLWKMRDTDPERYKQYLSEQNRAKKLRKLKQKLEKFFGDSDRGA